RPLVHRRIDAREQADHEPAEGEQRQGQDPGQSAEDATGREPEDRRHHPPLHQLAQAGDEEAADGGNDVAGRTLSVAHRVYSRSIIEWSEAWGLRIHPAVKTLTPSAA